MKRVTFRIPEDHEIACSTEIKRVTVTAEYGECFGYGHITQDGDAYGGSLFGWFGTFDEAIIAAAAFARNEVRRDMLVHKIAAF